jgi:hypothetical protein
MPQQEVLQLKIMQPQTGKVAITQEEEEIQ